MVINKATLYVVGTPIGNLSDFSPRAVEVLNAVDFIAAEDTRVSLKLLTHFGIEKQLISCHEHNIKQRSREIADRLGCGESCAIVTDAGMPCISDPGEELVKECAARGLDVCVVPGPSAAVSALAISGLATARFSFEGFLSVNAKQRLEHLSSVKQSTNTLIFYEAPHKLQRTLQDLYDNLGDRRISLCRELTKLHEEVIRGTISQMLSLYEEQAPKGEYVLVVEGYVPQEKAFTLDNAADRAMELIEGGMKPSDACKTAASETGFAKSAIYAVVNERKEQS